MIERTKTEIVNVIVRIHDHAVIVIHLHLIRTVVVVIPVVHPVHHPVPEIVRPGGGIHDRYHVIGMEERSNEIPHENINR